MPGLKTGMDFRGLVWKRVWKITFFDLKSGQDLKNRAHTPTKNFQEYPPPPPPGSTVKRGTSNSVFTWSTAFYNIQQSELFELILCELTRWRSSETPRGHYIPGSNAWREGRRCGVWGSSQQTTRKWQQRLHAYMFSLVSPAEQSLPVWRQVQNWKTENGCRFQSVNREPATQSSAMHGWMHKRLCLRLLWNKGQFKKTLWLLVPFVVHFSQPFIGDSLESVYIKRKPSNKKITWGRHKIVYVAWLYVTQGDKVSRPVSPQSFGRLPRFVRTFRASAKYSVVKKGEKVGKAIISVYLEESSKNLN